MKISFRYSQARFEEVSSISPRITSAFARRQSGLVSATTLTASTPPQRFSSQLSSSSAKSFLPQRHRISLATSQQTTWLLASRISTSNPSASTRKAILNIRLGDSTTQKPTGPPPAIAALESQWTLAKEKGFDFSVVYVDPANPEPAFEALEKTLKEKEGKWDGIVVGGGLRLNSECTGLLERIVAVCVNETWGKGGNPRFTFPSRPDDIVGSLKRVFPEIF